LEQIGLIDQNRRSARRISTRSCHLIELGQCPEGGGDSYSNNGNRDDSLDEGEATRGETARRPMTFIENHGKLSSNSRANPPHVTRPVFASAPLHLAESVK